MLKYVDSWLGQKTATASTTQIFTASEVPGSKIVEFHFELLEAGIPGTFTLADIDAFRIKAGGQAIMDMTIAQLRAYLQRISRGNIVLPTTATRFTIPLHIPDGKGDERNLCQFPMNQSPQIELVLNAGVPAAATTNIGWSASEQTPLFYPLFLREAHGIPASSAKKRYDIRRGGKIRGFVIPTTGLTELRIVISGVVLFSGNNAMLLEAQRLEGDEAQTLTDPIFIKLEEPMDAAIGSSFMEFTTGATWTATGEVAILSLIGAV